MVHDDSTAHAQRLAVGKQSLRDTTDSAERGGGQERRPQGAKRFLCYIVVHPTAQPSSEKRSRKFECELTSDTYLILSDEI